ncbi:tRNA uridine-5-carboxymethylaminomethyl(34) synthesis GTPase MnmE [Sphingomonas rubra]|uniref:tRNA uridine-5-carboxymethylaminomethyl(34) synthesis GTPase MnmE n=1 Tax=Sphingomonas rubra TaxID=634430 RepID=UPI000B2D7EC4|nr:tRNA uridine-5-carboxymethylaminomethyl(34) synthesis GTPase MnmE [Sphingomonas rubra]
MTDTIVALSSGRPPAAIGVIRVSGPAALVAAATLAGTLPPPRIAGLRALRDANGAMLDRALVLVFPGSRSATGEDLVEFHCHGGRAVIAAVEAALVAATGCRAALPGEFTRRALTNGRIDLAEAEGLADLLEAETEAQRVAALAAAEGRISRQVATWMASAAAISARIEALIDHDDEGDVETGEEVLAAIMADAAVLGTEIAFAVEAPPVERLRDGVRVVIAGPPNAGKSTLLNLLGEREAAIVSPIAGTTRDMVEAPVVRRGRAFVLTDTAGLTRSDDVVEMIGVDRARYAIEAADILLWLGDEPPPRDDAIPIHSRADAAERRVVPAGRLAISRDAPRSIESLWNVIEERASALLPRIDGLPWRQRHQQLCGEAAAALLQGSNDPVLLAENCRTARVRLAAIVGIDATEAMLDALFSRFCLGK